MGFELFVYHTSTRTKTLKTTFWTKWKAPPPRPLCSQVNSCPTKGKLFSYSRSPYIETSIDQRATPHCHTRKICYLNTTLSRMPPPRLALTQLHNRWKSSRFIFEGKSNLHFQYLLLQVLSTFPFQDLFLFTNFSQFILLFIQNQLKSSTKKVCISLLILPRCQKIQLSKFCI